MQISETKKALLRAFVNHTCESCHHTELELSQKFSKIIKLQPHRVKQGGDYNLRNIMMVCPICHGMFSSAQNKAMGITA